MGSGDIAGFVRELYGQLDKEGLVIDVRRNRGGNIDSWVLEKLLRRAWAFWQSPGSAPYWNMQQSFRGHVVVLTDPLTYSDGETFAAGFKALGLGPVIGRRTAGAGVWLSDRNRLADGGAARIAESPQFDAEGRWLIEGTGVEPDVTIDATPWATARGEDAQLAAAIQALEARTRAAPVRQPPAETLPKRGRGGHDARPGR
jgi:tricorn protease